MMHYYSVTGFPALLITLAMAAIVVAPFYQLWKRTGHSGWISLTVLVPVLNVIMIYVLAFKEWPALDQKMAAGEQK